MEEETTTVTTEYEPIKVVLHPGAVQVHESAADYGSYMTYVFTGTEQALRILPTDPNRARAYVTVAGTGPVWIGSEAQCRNIKAGASQSAGMVSAGYVATGITVPITNQQELWLVPDGSHSATVTIINERWVS